MNKLIDSLFEKDLVIKVVAILTAILIWFLVLDQDNPFEERTLAVPLTSNIEVLDENNLQIVGPSLPTSIDVKIRGRRKKISAITPNDFKAVIDLSEVTESGIKRIDIDTPEFLGDQDLIIVGINPSSVNLRFERIIGKQYPVNVEFTGKLPAGYELMNLKIEPNTAILEEKESSISQIGKVVAIINLDEIKDNKELVMRATVLNTAGQPLKQFEGKIPIIATFDLAKSVPVFVKTTGQPLTDWYLKELTLSMPKIRVIGQKSVLDGITGLNAADIDITGKSGTLEIPLELIAPKGTSLYKADLNALTAQVVLDKYITRHINVSASLVSIYNGDTTGAKGYRITNDVIPITVKGRPDVVNTLKPGDIKLSISVKDLEKGEHEVPLRVDVPSNVTLIGEYSVNITVEDAAEPGTPVE